MIRRFALVLVVLTLLTAAAWADGKNGLYWTSTTVADGVTVRRLEDSTSGVVCYVANSRSLVYGGTDVAIAISCIKVPQ